MVAIADISVQNNKKSIKQGRQQCIQDPFQVLKFVLEDEVYSAKDNDADQNFQPEDASFLSEGFKKTCKQGGGCKNAKCNGHIGNLDGMEESDPMQCNHNTYTQ